MTFSAVSRCSSHRGTNIGSSFGMDSYVSTFLPIFVGLTVRLGSSRTLSWLTSESSIFVLIVVAVFYLGLSGTVALSGGVGSVSLG